METRSVMVPGLERLEGFLQLRHLLQRRSELRGHVELRRRLQLHLLPGPLVGDGLLDEGLELRAALRDVRGAGEAHLPGALHVLGLLHQLPLRVLQQRTLVEEHRAIVVEAVHQEDVLPLEGVAGVAPLQLLGEAAVQGDGAQQGIRLLPGSLLLEEPVDGGVHGGKLGVDRFRWRYEVGGYQGWHVCGGVECEPQMHADGRGS